MRVDRLTLTDFRSYGAARGEFAPGVNVIAGENAQGKTNLLEAVYLLTVGRSFRTRFDKELIAFDRDAALVEGEIHAAGREQTVKIVLRRGARKQIWQNGVKKSAAALTRNLTAVLFSPEDLSLVRAGAAERRRFLDLAICQLRPNYQKLLTDYAKVLDAKTRILRDWREKPSLLDSLQEHDMLLCRLGARILRYRAAFVRRLGEAAGPIHREFSGGRETLELAYATVSTVLDPAAAAETIAGQLWEHLERHAQAERAAGRSLSGVHKDDILISLNGRSARDYASQGQTRTAALSLKLGEREILLQETGEYPVLLLDDVLSELDESRQSFVLNRIGGGQTLITCCETGDMARRTGGRVLTITKGEIICTST